MGVLARSIISLEGIWEMMTPSMLTHLKLYANGQVWSLLFALNVYEFQDGKDSDREEGKVDMYV